MPKLVERALDFTVVGVKSKSMRVAALLKEKNAKKNAKKNADTQKRKIQTLHFQQRTSI